MMSAAKGLIVAVISLVIGIIMLLFYVNYVDSSNTAPLDANTLNIINSIPVFLGLSLLGVAVGSIWAGFSGAFGGGKKTF
jgi:hypothetical protein